MKGENLPNSDHIVRYVKPSSIQEDGTVDGSEFRLRPHRPDEVGVSVNWLEVFDGDRAEQLRDVRRRYRLSVKRNGRFAELNVGAVKQHVAEELETVRIVHDPLEAEEAYPDDESHAEIVGLPDGNSDEAMLVGDMIAECVLDMHEAVDD